VAVIAAGSVQAGTTSGASMTVSPAGWSQTTPVTTGDANNQVRMGAVWRMAGKDVGEAATFTQVGAATTGGGWAVVALLVGAASAGDAGAELIYDEEAKTFSVLNTDKGSDAVDAHKSAENPHGQYLRGIQQGTGVVIDNTDPQRPKISATGGGGGGGGGVAIVDYGDLSLLGPGDAGSVVFFKIPPDPEMHVSLPPVISVTLDETEGDFIDHGPNAWHFTPSATAVRGLSPADPAGGYSARAADASGIAARTPASSFVEGQASVSMWLHIPAATTTTYGEFFKIGTGGNGFDVGISDNQPNTSAAAPGRYIKIGQNGIAWRNTGIRFSDDEQDVHLGITWTSAEVRFYVNGMLAGVFNWSNYNSPSPNILIGRGESGNAETTATMLRLDRVSLFKGILTAEDMKLLAWGNVGKVRGYWDGTKLQPLA